jgi:hypothetical protein
MRPTRKVLMVVVRVAMKKQTLMPIIASTVENVYRMNIP